MDIRVDTVGKVIAGDDVGVYVKIVDDAKNTGGFLILTSKSLDMTDGFDSWVVDYDALKNYFEESNWVVVWL